MSLVKCTVRDLMGELTQRRMTPEGFLIAPGTIARAGNIQEYRASELGFDVIRGMDANQIVRLYRPTSEVHSPETIASFEGQTLTMGHPFEGVDADNWQKVAIGDVRGVAAEGEGVKSELIVRHADAVKDISTGKRQLSCGYTFDCDMTPGRTADGKAYDGTMTNIRGNHVAVVDMARGGPGCRIADGKNNHPPLNQPDRQEMHMATRKIVIAKDTHLELEDSQASLVQRIDSDYKDAVKVAQDSASAATARAADAEAALKAEKEASAKLVTDHAAVVADLKSKIQTQEQIEALATARAKEITDAQVEKLATERAKVVADARRLSPEIETDGKTVAAIRAEVVTSVLTGDSALKAVAVAMLDGVAVDKASVEAVSTAFKAIAAAPAADAAASDAEDHDADIGRRLAGGDRSRKPTLSAEAVMRYRMKYGKDPEAAA